MSTPLVLPTPDPLDTASRPLVLAPFDVPTTASDPDSDASTPTSLKPPALVCQWSGTPIRAIVPLPRRKLVFPIANVSGTVPACTPSTSSSATRTRLKRVWDDADSDSDIDTAVKDGGDHVKVGVDVDGESDGEWGAVRPRYCSYESITAAEGLSAYSFEELRVECYAQSLVARGTRPPPVIQLTLAIPPAFVPRAVPRS